MQKGSFPSACEIPDNVGLAVQAAHIARAGRKPDYLYLKYPAEPAGIVNCPERNLMIQATFKKDLSHALVMLLEVQTCTTDPSQAKNQNSPGLVPGRTKVIKRFGLFSTSSLCFDAYARLQKVITSQHHMSRQTDVTYIVTRTVWKRE
ncbi:hypothetical protein BTVI_55159 [Pitangus sulphuratus]|nr:hypothetical protein BTVI_55159 [Pitangus sulphuratus]